MAVAQITVRLPSAMKAEFETYAEQMSLDASELVKLLIVRERKLQRLSALTAAGGGPLRTRQPRGSAVILPTITAHLSDVGQVAEFDKYANSCGLNRNSAAAWLLETELQERWLEKAILI